MALSRRRWGRHRWGSAARLVLVLVLAVAGACAPHYILPSVPVGDPMLRHEYFLTADGRELPLRVWRPGAQTAAAGAYSDGQAAGVQTASLEPVDPSVSQKALMQPAKPADSRVENPRAVILALHGFNDYSNAFAAPAAYWATQGIITYAYDQRGFGGAPFHGRWAGTEAMIDDLVVASRLIHARHPDLPLYLVGESMGAAVIMAALASPEPPVADGVVLVAPAIWARSTMPVWQRAGLWVLSHTVPSLTVSGRGLGRQASDNIEMLRALGRDPLVIKETRIGAVKGLVDLMDAALAAAPELRGRILILYGDNEEIIPDHAREVLEERVPDNGCIRFAEYKSGYHMLLRDLDAEIVRRDIVAWIFHPGEPLPSGADTVAERGGADRGYALNCRTLKASARSSAG